MKLRPLWKGFHYFDHQREGIEWMLEHEINGVEVPSRKGSDTVCVRGGLQCDEMGLGKTIQTISVMAHHLLETTLLLAPLAMVQTWTEVCEKAGFLVFHPYGSDWECVNSDESLSQVDPAFSKIRPEIYITNYEKLYHHVLLFRGKWGRVVLDEAHKIRNPFGDIAYAVRKLDTKIRWAITGTPLVNSWKDVAVLLGFIGVPVSPMFRWEPHLLAALPLVVLHRSLESLRPVLKDAPPRPVIKEIELPFATDAEEEFYYGIQGSTDSMVKKYSNDQFTSAEAFLMILRLRQISVHPQVYINAKRRESSLYSRRNWYTPSTKMLAVADILRRDSHFASSHHSTDVHKYILFCQFKDEMDLFHDFFVAEELVKEENILHYDGSMTQAERTAVLEKSKQTTETTVLLLQLQAGGVGLNLQEYDRIIFISPWWTSALRDQAIARAVRMGQKKVVHVYHLRLAAEDDETVISIDSLVHKKAEEKARMLETMFKICHNEDVNENEKENKKENKNENKKENKKENENKNENKKENKKDKE